MFKRSANSSLACHCVDRRHFLHSMAGSAAITLFPSIARAGGAADALVLTCMDYRIVDDAVTYFNARGLRNKYDHVVLAGAGVGALGKIGADWASTFWKHVETAITLHQIKELIVVNHRDCGAVKIVYGSDSISDRSKETKLHRNLLFQLTQQTNGKFPSLRTQMLLMDLDGSVEDISGQPDEDVADALKHSGTASHAAPPGASQASPTGH